MVEFLFENRMPQAPEKPRRKTRWTYEEYYRMADAGVFRDQRVELINGEIVEMPPQGEPHYTTILIGSKRLERAFGDGYVVRTQGPLRTGQDEEPEPDIAVIVGTIGEMLAAGRPRSAVLVVEVSVTTLDYDLGEKAEIYAAAGIEDYWVIDLQSRLIHVHRRTIVDPSMSRGRRYSQIEVLSDDKSIAPLAVPNQSIRIADLLP
jgi:Uma2 family endonuclease